MLRKTIIAAGIIASSVAFNQAAFAGAATVTQTQTDDTYAQELFGTGSNAVVLTSTGSTVILTVGGVVDPGETADFTFTLTGANYGATVPLTALVYTGLGGVTITKTAGGAAGDTSVTFRVQIDAALAANETLKLSIPSLTSASGLADTAAVVNCTTSIVQVSTSGVDTFPTSITIADAVADVLVADSEDEVTLTVADGTAATIDVDNRVDVTGGETAIDHDDDGDPDDTRDGIHVGDVTLDINAIAGNLQSDNFDYDVGAGDDGEGDIAVTVTGTLNAGDLVFLDLNSNGILEAGEGLSISGNTATGSFANDMMVLVGGASPLYVVVNGTSTLVPSTYSVSVSTGYDSGTGLVETATGTTTTSYSGLSQDGWTLAIPGSGQSDIANIRITNETSAVNTVFAQCYGQDGTNLGFEEVVSLAANETKVLKNTDLEAIFGTWSGRARCDFSRSGNISVQTMIRSGGILNNMNGSAGLTTTDTYASDDGLGAVVTTATSAVSR